MVYISFYGNIKDSNAKAPPHSPPAQTLMQFNSVDSRFGKGLYGGLWGKLSWRGSRANY